MKVEQIRQGVFETNSSSSHSLVIDGNSTDFDTIVPDDDGLLHFELNEFEFGWGYEKYTDPWTKAVYCLIDIACIKDPNARTKYYEMFYRVVREHTGAEHVTWDNEATNSYIDHQSVGTARAEAFFNSNTLKNFIFGKESYLVIDNDNN